MSKKNVVNNEIKNEKENVTMSKKGNKAVEEMKAVNELAALLEETIVKKDYSLSADDLLHLVENGKYYDKSNIKGDCHVYIQSYETDVCVRHADNTFVYSMDKDNPAVEDIQPDSILQAYVRLRVKLVQGKKTDFTTITVYEGTFDRLATSLMGVLNCKYPEGKPMSLLDLLDNVIASGTPIPAYRAVNSSDVIVTYWCMFTHQPRYKIQFKLNKEENYAIMREALKNNLYYSILPSGKQIVVTIEDLFVRFRKEDDKEVVSRLGLKLTAEDFVYIIDLQVPMARTRTDGTVSNEARRNGVMIAIRNIIRELSSVVDAAKFDTVEDLCNAFKGHKTTFKRVLKSNDGVNKYEVFYFGKEVK